MSQELEYRCYAYCLPNNELEDINLSIAAFRIQKHYICISNLYNFVIKKDSFFQDPTRVVKMINIR